LAKQPPRGAANFARRSGARERGGLVLRLALTLAYDGLSFDGWQTQPSGNTVQDHLESALTQMAGHRVSTVCAGRTDAGVHGLGQVVHFDTQTSRPVSAWVRGVNSHLPESIAVLSAQSVRDDFHARFDALERCYRYYVAGAPTRHPLTIGRAGWVHRDIDLAPMREAAQALVGKHDFSSFRSAQCQAATPVRTINRIELTGSPQMLCIRLLAGHRKSCSRVTARAALRHLVGKACISNRCVILTKIRSFPRLIRACLISEPTQLMTTAKTSIKFCGLVRAEDVQFAAQLEVNALGLMFYEKSSRLIDLDTARQLRALMPSWITCVGLFVNSPPDQVKAYSSALGLDVVQFHGDETHQICQESLLPGQPYWRAIRVREQADLVNSWSNYPDAKAFVLDAYSEGFGGSGHQFDWSLIPADRPESLIMSGGLDSHSVVEVIEQIAPFGVDVSSGIQGEDPRMKDHRKMQAFVDAVAQTDAAANQRVSR